jgi:hypothetical protein
MKINFKTKKSSGIHSDLARKHKQKNKREKKGRTGQM